MGFLQRITNSGNSNQSTNNSGLANGAHAINKDVVLRPTDPTVINPINTGEWQSIRTAPINQTPRYFSEEETKALKAQATQATQGARNSKKAYKSLVKIEEADATVHQSHRRYIKGVASAELKKKRADASTARKLHAQRPQYAQLGQSIDRAENKADQQIQELKNKFNAVR